MPYRLEKYLTNLNKPICKQVVAYYEKCQFEWNFTAASMQNKVSALNHFLRFSNLDRLENITNEMVTAYIKYQTESGLKPRTINDRTKHILALVRYYRDEEDMEIPNFKDKKIKKQHEEPSEKRAFSRETIYRVLACADREEWLLIKIAFDCGLRINELRQMRLKDLDGKTLTVHGKGRKLRFVILSDEVITRLHDWISRQKVTNYIWESRSVTHRGQPKSCDALRKKMRKPFTACGVYRACPHELRHSFASDLLDLGATERGIQKVMGHSTVKTTEIYLHELAPGKETRQLYDLKYSAPAPELR